MAALSRRQFPPEPKSVGEARSFVAEVLAGCPPLLVQDVQLIVSELATNCVVHAESDFDLVISSSADQIHVEVTDEGHGFPVFRPSQGDDERGRGLVITDTLSAAWGVERRGSTGKAVWFSVPVAVRGRD